MKPDQRYIAEVQRGAGKPKWPIPGPEMPSLKTSET